MIEVTRLGSQPIVINADLIEFVEQTPDTMIITTSGKRIMVQETVAEVVLRVVEYRRQCLAKASPLTAPKKPKKTAKK
jgi:flagellar protein FlbD